MKHARLVSAPAGSGKTTRLVKEYLQLLGDFDADRIVAITFTRKAAAELVERVSQVLRGVLGLEVFADLDIYRAAAPSPERARLALSKLAGAPIGTVDAFLQRMLREQILDAYVPLPGAGRAWLDGVELSADGAAYERAAREVLEARGEDAERLLRHATVADVTRSIAALAGRSSIKRVSAVALRDAIAADLRSRVAAQDPLFRDLGVSAVKKPGSAHHRAVAAWLSEPLESAPDGLVPWLAAIAKGGAVGAQRRAVASEIFATASEAIGLPRMDASAFDTLEIDTAWGTEGALAMADALAEALERLAAAARTIALRDMASAGALGYAELLDAATALCEAAPPALRARYDALLVDEVQDTSAAQLALYRAFASLRDEGPGAPIRSFFVGDVRQSIYRFRDADPEGWARLAATPGIATEPLQVNRRSVPELVRAQELLFGGMDGVESLGAIEATRAHHASAEPVHVVDAGKDDDPDELAVHRFASRLRALRAAGDRGAAAVLVRSWPRGARARDWLRAHGFRAQLTGDKALLSGRVATDVRLFLSALLDPTDDVAMVGVLKHPSIGVSDAGLLALRSRGGPGLASLFRPAQEEAWPDADIGAYRRGSSPLREARRALGREPTADVLERLVAELSWRPLLEHGPEGADGQAFAELEVVLELIRNIEDGAGTDPHEVRRRLEDADESQDDLPPVRLGPGADIVTVTTIHASKGLEWAHVAIVGAENVLSRLDSEGLVATVKHPDGPFGVRCDPGGGLDAVVDPVGKLWGIVDGLAARDEAARLFYVAFTRARDTVTLSLPKEPKEGTFAAVLRGHVVPLGDSRRADLAKLVLARPADPADVRRAEPVQRACLTRLRPFSSRWEEARGLVIAQPSALARELTHDQREAIRSDLASRAAFCEAALRAAARPHALDGELERTVGELCHGWLEAWAFEGDPRPVAATRYLGERYGLAGAEADETALWLCDTGRRVRDELPGFATLLEGARLHFEQPLLGVTEGAIVTGRTDLTIERPDGSFVVVDFKAGSRVATSAAPEDIPHFGDYALQLDAYRRVLEGAGKRVAEVGLLFVRGPTWVRFPQPN